MSIGLCDEQRLPPRKHVYTGTVVHAILQPDLFGSGNQFAVVVRVTRSFLTSKNLVATFLLASNYFTHTIHN